MRGMPRIGHPPQPVRAAGDQHKTVAVRAKHRASAAPIPDEATLINTVSGPGR